MESEAVEAALPPVCCTVVRPRASTCALLVCSLLDIKVLAAFSLARIEALLYEALLYELLRANGEGARLDQEEDATRGWRDGRLQAALHMCRREARALARIAIAAEARLPGRQATATVGLHARPTTHTSRPHT